MKYLIATITLWNPFSLIAHSSLSKLYLHLSGSDGHGLSAKIFSVFYTLLFYFRQKVVSIPEFGKFGFRSKKIVKTINFNSANTQFESIYNPLFKYGYEPEVSALISLFLDRKSAFYDIGSNWGYFSLYAASLPSFNGHIYAFEPFPSTFRDLNSTVIQAGLQDKISCLQLALGKQTAAVNMRYQGLLQSGLAALDYQNSSTPISYLYPSSRVEVTSLDKVVIDPPSIIKIDVEGLEFDVLQGGEKAIRKYRPAIVIENCTWNKDISQTLDPLTTLEKWGYDLYYPCWLVDHNQDQYLSSELTIGSRNKKPKLVLRPITSTDRFLYGRQINIFACHSSRQSLLKTRFQAK